MVFVGAFLSFCKMRSKLKEKFRKVCHWNVLVRMISCIACESAIPGAEI